MAEVGRERLDVAQCMCKQLDADDARRDTRGDMREVNPSARSSAHPHPATGSRPLGRARLGVHTRCRPSMHPARSATELGRYEASDTWAAESSRERGVSRTPPAPREEARLPRSSGTAPWGAGATREGARRRVGRAAPDVEGSGAGGGAGGRRSAAQTLWGGVGCRGMRHEAVAARVGAASLPGHTASAGTATAAPPE